MKFTTVWVVGLLVATRIGYAAPAPAIVDKVVFGDSASEHSHGLSAEHSEVFRGGLGESARRLLALTPRSWQGGAVAFTLKVDPEKPTYATVRLWGSDETTNCLSLFCEGKQIGYRHLGDVDLLDIGGGEPGYNGRFIYSTSPLPLEMTHGKTELHFEIRSSGQMWPYGTTFATFQHPMTEPSRGIYALSTHIDGFFIPPTGEKQGAPMTNPPVRRGPGPEVLADLKARVDGEVKKLLAAPSQLNQMQIQFLARAYHVAWTSAYQRELTIERVVGNLDGIYMAYRKNPHLAASDPATPNADWFGLGPAGDAIRLLAEPLVAMLDAAIDDGLGKRLARRAAYAEMLVACREWHRRHRRLYTNQTMINDLYGIYLANRGVAVVSPTQAVPEPEIRRYLYESVGLEPWRDSDPGGEGPSETGGKPWGVGADYWQLTAKGLTRELGYVGYYGEVLDWVATIYEATRPTIAEPGDEKIRAALVRMEKARGVFRYPMVDAEGNRAMRIEAVVGWRDPGHYPGDVTYGERMSWDGSALYAVAAARYPDSIGYAQQMLADNQFFAMVRDRMKDRGFRVTAGLLEVPQQYDWIKAQPPSASRLPMTPGQPDFVFSDEEDGVVAVKDGDTVLYASLYWRAHRGVNFLARVHFTQPTIDRIAVVREEAEFESSGLTIKRPDWTVFNFGNGGPRYPVEVHSVQAGEILPIAKLPVGLRFTPGDENVYAGKASFYTLHYGDYLIGMNLTRDQSFDLKTPAGRTAARDLVAGCNVILDTPIKVGPRSTVVLKLKP